MINYKEKFKNIKNFVFDVDGVLTNGGLYILPSGEFMRKMNAKRKQLQPFGSITGLKLRQSGEKVHVRDAGWFIISKNWSSAQAM